MNNVYRCALTLCASILGFACDDPANPEPILGIDEGVRPSAVAPVDAQVTATDGSRNLDVDDASVLSPKTDAEVMMLGIDPSQYCEVSAEMFCRFYMRCDRMAADSEMECQAVFLETCNQRYEPIYTSLVDEGFLSLSRSGLDACEAHLAVVDCAEQIFDLDGPCAQIWVGQQGEGEPCSYGIDSFVCAPGLSCRVNTSLCGECRKPAQAGQVCTQAGDCEGSFFCNDGTCQPRRKPGEPCTESSQCVVSAWCFEGECQSFIRSRLGEPCDQERRCPYKAVCSMGICQEIAALGQPCTPNLGCMSGYCDQVCQPFRGLGEPCESAAQCRHNRCTNGRCGPSVSDCLTSDTP